MSKFTSTIIDVAVRVVITGIIFFRAENKKHQPILRPYLKFSGKPVQFHEMTWNLYKNKLDFYNYPFSVSIFKQCELISMQVLKTTKAIVIHVIIFTMLYPFIWDHVVNELI